MRVTESERQNARLYLEMTDPAVPPAIRQRIQPRRGLLLPPGTCALAARRELAYRLGQRRVK